jgi:hypothetical protein
MRATTCRRRRRSESLTAALPRAPAAVRRVARRGAARIIPRPLLDRVLGHRVKATEQLLERVAARGVPILAGPWTSEVGFEILYWIPFLRWFAAHHDVDAAQITALSRGGVSAWYGEVAGRYRELLDDHTPEELFARRRRRLRTATAEKQLWFDPADVDLLPAKDIGRDVAWLHPAAMHQLFRWFWSGRAPVSLVLEHTAHAPLSTPPPPRELPPRYVAVKLYASRVLADTAANWERLGRAVERLAHRYEVVVLPSGPRLDEHVSRLEPKGRLHVLPSGSPAHNLGDQSAVVAGASALVTTYGGFAYLGAQVGTPTIAIGDAARANAAHLTVLRHIEEVLGRDLRQRITILSPDAEAFGPSVEAAMELS